MSERRFTIGPLAERSGVRTLGLALDEIREVLEMVGEGREPCMHVRDRLRERLAEVREKTGELRRLESRLLEALRRPSDGAGTGGCRCEIIEAAGSGARPTGDDGAGRGRVPGPGGV